MVIRKPRLAFSLTTLFVLTLLVAIGVVVWQRFIYQPPTHGIPLYERAAALRGTQATLGQSTTLSIRAVVRNERDRGLYLQNGRGQDLGMLALHHEQALTTANSWLDVVCIELEPGADAICIDRVRIFDHTTRRMLSDGGESFGWQVLPDNDILICGLGQDIPELLDVWLDVNVLQPDKPSYRIDARTGEELQLPGGMLRVQEVISGEWSMQDGVIHRQKGRTVFGGTAVRFHWQGQWQLGRLQLAAVAKDGTRRIFDKTLDPTAVVGDVYSVRTPISELSHLELRSLDAKHWQAGRPFFFEALRVPANRGLPFSAPPKPVWNTGLNGRTTIKEFYPLQVRVETVPDLWMGGVSMGEHMGGIHLRTPVETGEPPIYWTLCYQLRGISNRPLNVLVDGVAPNFNRARGQATTTGEVLGSATYPVTEDESMELTFELGQQ